MAVPVVIAALLCGSRAEAYRPFDGTDADVAEPAPELEMGPVHWYDRGGQQYLLAPVTVLNFGILPGTELVIDFRGSLALDRSMVARARRCSTGDIVVKHVLRKGTLQGSRSLALPPSLGL